ncbi:MAG: 50S ribosomal protein L17 [Candidatus Peregrinibacteria bacterium]|nr:50S ribosomal protein L17 [Candidatus Peregrinibacteria bacterium]
MRHRHSRRRLRYKPAHSRLLQRNLVTSLLLYETVRTTKKRAEVVQPVIDHLIAMAKSKEPMNAIRFINRIVTDKNASRKVMEVLVKRFEKRPSGFTRIVPLGSRAGDGAKVVTLALVDATDDSPVVQEKKKRKKSAAPASTPSA